MAMFENEYVAPAGLDKTIHLNGMRTFLEVSPAAISLWSLDRSFCVLNQSARRLINYTETDFLNRCSLWLERIHPDDQQKFSRFEDALRAGKSPMQCDYRFLPGNSRSHIWLREISAVKVTARTAPLDIVSVYTDISDLRSSNAAEIRESDSMNALKLLSHEFMNCVQKVILELEFAKLGLKGNIDSKNLVSTADEVKRSVMGLQDQLGRLFENCAPHDPAAILHTSVQKLRKELHRQRVKLQLVNRGPLPLVRGDKDQLLRAFERVFEFCGAMLKHGGNLEVEAGPKEVGGDLYAEVKVTSSSTASVESSHGKAFQSHGNGENHRVTLGMTVAAEILQRYHGQVAFRQASPNQGEVTILIKASPNQRSAL